MLRHIDETHMSRKFNVKVNLFSGKKISDTHYYLIHNLIKKSDYIVLHAGTNGAVNTEVSVIVDTLPQLKCFVKENLP